MKYKQKNVIYTYIDRVGNNNANMIPYANKISL